MSDMLKRAIRAVYDATEDHLTFAEGDPFYERVAIAVIEAMREPSIAMVDAGDTALEDCTDSSWDSGCDGEGYNSYEFIISGAQTTIYQAMIDAALASAGEAGGEDPQGLRAQHEHAARRETPLSDRQTPEGGEE